MTDIPDEIVDRVTNLLSNTKADYRTTAELVIEAILPDLREMIGRECAAQAFKFDHGDADNIADAILEATRKP